MPIDRTGSNTTIEIPNTVHQYNIVHTLGRGPNSVQKLATNSEDGKKYALKFMPVCDLKAKGIMNNLLSMIKTVQTFNHPNILKVYEYFEIENPDSTDEKSDNVSHLLVVVQDYCARGTLLNLLSMEGRLSEVYARSLFTKMLQGISYLHGLKVVHRQLTLESILITADDEIKITNFSYSHKLVQYQLLMTQCGTPIFAAPEIIKNQPYDGTKADMWALGVILYTMVSGQMPWDSQKNAVEMINQIVSAKYAIPSYFSAFLSDLISHLLIIQPESRLSADDCIIHSWIRNESTFQLRKDFSVPLQKRKSSSYSINSFAQNDKSLRAVSRPVPKIIAPTRRRVVSKSVMLKNPPF
ncbi:hypothetical protein M9Y10_015238 [Tritrichomonas musculus]|uniref:Protein kinase domain-containing protein n=1 Tax=Tritrichomonas musculus TaxID=1915356 RepID=A0ABR2L1V4_9EUKA